MKDSDFIWKKNGKSLKFMWINDHTLIFEWEKKLKLPSSPYVYGTKKQIVIAQKGKNFCFLSKNGGYDYRDYLCFFCKFWISWELILDTRLPSCLLGKECGCVRFCRDFKPGTPFGEDKKLDLERLDAAEQINSKIGWGDCFFCKYQYPYHGIRVVENGKEKSLEDYGSMSFLDDENVSAFIIDGRPAFCNLFKVFPTFDFEKNCKGFEVLEKKDMKFCYEQRKNRLKDYIDSLKNCKKK